MLKPNRRECLQGALAAMAAAAAPSIASSISPMPAMAEENRGTRQAGDRMTIALIWGDENQHLVRLSEQIGVTHAIAGTAKHLRGLPRSEYPDAISKLKAGYEAAGLKIAAIESHPVDADKIKLGLPGRDEEIENYIAAIESLGQVGIPVVCYDFMAGIDWYRSNLNLPGRGGSSTMSFDLEDAEKLGLTQWGRISAERMWGNIEYFLKAVIPVAEKSGVRMALHPDDPPVPELRGIARIITSAESYRRVMRIVPSPVNGVTFEISVLTLMGEDTHALAREWCCENKVFYVHARNIRGKRDHFVETFQDDGEIDFGEIFQSLYDSGFRGPLRPDHDPILDGETDVRPGYGVLGKIFGVGYIKGIMASRHIPYA